MGRNHDSVDKPNEEPTSRYRLLQDAQGKAARAFRAVDWSKTPLGPVETWPDPLITMLAMALHSNQAYILYWGPEMVCFYNDAYIPFFSDGKHPSAMGQRAKDVFADTWDFFRPVFEDVFAGARHVLKQDHLIPMIRGGKVEEVYWTYCFCPIFCDQNQVGGIITPCFETTRHVLDRRRLQSGASLSESILVSQTVEDLVVSAAATFAKNKLDIPFALINTLDALGQARSQSVGILPSWRKRFNEVFAAPLAQALQKRQALLAPMPPGVQIQTETLPWPEPVSMAYIVPLMQRKDAPNHMGHVIFGLSPRLAFDEAYKGYLEHLAAQLGTAVRLKHSQSKAEQALKRQSEDFRLISELIPQLVWRSDPAGKIDYVNQRFLDYTGSLPRDVYDLRWLNAVHPEDRERVSQHIAASSEERVSHPLEFRLRRSDGVYHWFLARENALRSDEQRALEYYGTFTDIEEQKSAKLAAEQASQLKSAFLANMSHEIRTPLGLILGFTDVLVDPSIDPNERSEFVTIVKRNSQQLLRLIDDILDLSKVEAGYLKIELTDVAIRDLIAEICEGFTPNAAEKGLTLTCKVADDVPARIRTDPTRLRQILFNLLSNAFKFTHQGSIRIDVASRENGTLDISIEDSGIGIPPEQARRLFSPFSQGDPSITRKYGGTGLGLALSHKIAQALGGELRLVASWQGHGSVFRLNMPLTIDQAHALTA